MFGPASAARHDGGFRVVDVVVVGAGPAGSAVAITLTRLNRMVVVLERSTDGQRRFAEHLPPSSRPLLRWLGIGDVGPGPRRSHGISVDWGDHGVRHTDYMLEPYSFGYGVDRVRFDRQLADIAQANGAEIQRRAQATLVERLPDGRWAISVTGPDGYREQIVCRFLVDATGRSGRIGRAIGSRREPVDHLVGVAVMSRDGRIVNALEDRLIVESSRNGWWYASALSSREASIVFLTDADILRDDPAPLAEYWNAELASTRLIRRVAGEPDGDAHPVVRSAATSLLRPMAGAGWLAVGDAAVSRDPLASDGIALALRWGIDGAHAIGRALQGDASDLARIVRARDDYVAQYLRDRCETYRREQRWPDATFWRRRHRPPIQPKGVDQRSSGEGDRGSAW